jgi:hypothetical protein
VEQYGASLIGDNLSKWDQGRRVALPTLQLGEPAERDMLDFSAPTDISRSQPMSNEGLYRKEAETAHRARPLNRPVVKFSIA